MYFNPPAPARFTSNTLSLLIAVGYVAVLYWIFSRHSSGSDQHLRELIRNHVEASEKILAEKDRSIKNLRLKINSLQAYSDTRKAAVDLIMTHKSVVKSVQPNDVKLDVVDNLPTTKIVSLNNPHSSHNGVIILGMHRSGTSVLGGLVNRMGLQTGGPLLPPTKDNEKGYFERFDVMNQNDKLMQRQQINYAFNTQQYDPLIGLKDALIDNSIYFKDGTKALNFLNDPGSVPWMLKDPRLCITFRTWLPLLKHLPVILFSYRHPLDVALSMNKRETEHFKISRVLKLWYVYNMRAILQSQDLCRVVTSHKRIMSNPRQELDYIYDQLLNCGLEVPHRVADEDLFSFVDPKLQHGKSALDENSCNLSTISDLMPPSTWPTQDAVHLELYRNCIRLYCGMEDGSAFKPHFPFILDMKDA